MAPLLDRLEALGNRLPDPLVLFGIVGGAVLLASQLFAGVSVEDPLTHSPVVVRGLLDAAGLREVFTKAVSNFTGFPPLGTVLVAMMGIGLAERTGLIGDTLGRLVRGMPPRALTAALLFAGVNSSLAADAGFVVLIPLGAALFAQQGRHPLAGITIAYAAVSGGFGANLLITALDPMLAGITEAAARLVDPTITVAATCNWWFSAAAVLLLTVVGAALCDRVEASFGPWTAPPPPAPTATVRLGPALWAMGLGVLAVVGLLAGGVLWDGAQGPKPLYDSVVLLIAGLAFLGGAAHGWSNGLLRSSADLARELGAALGGMGGYIVLAFAAAQFTAWFGWSKLGVVMAVKGAAAMAPLGLGPLPFLLAMVLVSGVVNLVIASASAKWALMAPVFVPMLLLLGVAPDQTQAAYRVGDAVTNILTPLLPYMPILLQTARRYQPEAGLGTLLSRQVPFALAFGLTWTPLLLGWVALGWPLGPG